MTAQTQDIQPSARAGFHRGLKRLLAGRRRAVRPSPLEAPIRSLLFGSSRFEQHGRSLAQTHAVVPGRGGGAFFPRLDSNARALQNARRYLEEQAARGRHQGPAATWLIDNAALLDEQARAIRLGLPRGFFRKLPLLRDEPLAGLPRIYSVAWAWVAHTDSGFDPGLLDAYLHAYQSVQPLTLAELWALHATLRVVLLENLRRLAERVAAQEAAREAAHGWIDGGQHDFDALSASIDAAHQRGVGDALALTLMQRADELDAEPASRLHLRLQQWLPEPAAALAAQQSHAAEDQQSIRNAISTLRELDRCNWRDRVAACSPVMGLLNGTPVFAAEAEATQDATLHAIEDLAHRGRRSELEVATAIAARSGAGATDDPRSAPAYWWRGAGENELREQLGLPRRLWPRRGSDALRRVATVLYFAALTGLVAAALGLWLHGSWHLEPGWLLTLAALLLLFPLSEAVVAVTHRLISESLPPLPLPRLALAHGVPAEHRVLVVIPALINTPAAVGALAEQLEQHHIANREPQAQFALLTDFADADQAVTEGDAAVLIAARTAIERLNHRHPVGAGTPPRFLLLHRERRWSDTERRWIGHERKRGKLEELLQLLAEPGTSAPFIDFGALSTPASATRYLVTLDADTGMPPGRLRALVGVAAHPLNQPQIDPVSRRVVAGYGILQPRMALPLPGGAASTGFHRLFAGEPGIDAYSAASSEIYQDLFSEGSFTGKGLLHVRACHATLGSRLPAGQVLSHDLLEGSLARCAGVSDITLEEDAPVHADVAASRIHRWTRGDWQLLPFLFGRRRLPLWTIQRWKMLDNLRRSLVAPASLLLLLLALATGVLPVAAALLAVAAAFGAGPLIGAVAGMAPSRDDIGLRRFFGLAAAELLRTLLAALWQMAGLLQTALLQADAIVRALWRQAVTRRHLLQWTTAAAAQAMARTTLPALLRQHWRTAAVAAGLGALLLALEAFGPADGSVPISVNSAWALPLLALWGAGGLWTWLVSRPLAPGSPAALDAAQADYLAELARETWRYYERWVGEGDSHLPPDNVQFSPHTMVAHRTSPTNIGLYLLGTACAQQLGFIGRVELAERVAATLATLERLPRHHGHLYNWYDTQTLAVLPPAYVSTVDSGNCCAHLLVLASALDAAAASADTPADSRVVDRLRARLAPLRQALSDAPGLRELCTLIDARPAWPLERSRVEALLQTVSLARQEFDALQLAQAVGDEPGPAWLLHDLVSTLGSLLRDVLAEPGAVQRELRALAERARALALAADFGLLYDHQRKLLHIGLRVDTQTLDAGHYDLLASEARLTSLLAIAKGDVPVAHWAALGRPLFAHGAAAGLRSWSGSMFEYLMPTLVLDEPAGSVLHAAVRTALALQREEAVAHGTPWGISESAIASQDHTLAYQYAPQGVASLALRRTPADERVLAPYASALALRVDPQAAIANLQALEALGARRALGFVEALDYTPQRQAAGRTPTLVYTTMAHHQGMSLLAMCEVLSGGAVQSWSRHEPHLRAVQSLLHERAPRELSPLRVPLPLPRSLRTRATHLALEVDPERQPLPATQVLGNGRHGLLIDSRGSGWSRWNGQGLNRWRDDRLRGAHGHFFYLQKQPAGDRKPGARQSLTALPAPDPLAEYRCRLLPDRVSFEAIWPELTARCTVWVSPEDDCELRRVELCNTGTTPMDLVLSSAFEPTLAPPAADEAHPAFSNLFLQARWDADDRALHWRREARLATEPTLFAVHALVHDESVDPGQGAGSPNSPNSASSPSSRRSPSSQPCSDRRRWLGRYGTPAMPAGDGGASLLADGTLDTGLDPVSVINTRLRLAPAATTVLTFITAASDSAETLNTLLDKYRERRHIERASSLSHTFASIRLRDLQFDAETWRALLSLNSLIAGLTTRDQVREAGVAALPADGPVCDRRVLWRHGIGGDRPVLAVTVSSEEGIALVQTLVRVLPVWTAAGIGVDLVIINAEPAAYLTPVQNRLQSLLDHERALLGESLPAQLRSSMRVLRDSDLTPLERRTLALLASVRLRADTRALGDHVAQLIDDHERDHAQRRRIGAIPVAAVLTAPSALPAAAPVGRFDPQDGRFTFQVTPSSRPERPWVNVLANAQMGCHVSEVGGGHAWAGNSRMHQITRWSNDPLSDPAAECLLLHCLDSGRVWPLGRVLVGVAPRQVEHGLGWTRMQQRIDGLDVTLTWCMDAEHAVRQTQVHIEHRGNARRNLRLVAMSEWLMGSTAVDRLTLDTAGLPLPGRVAAVRVTQLDHSGGFGNHTAVLALTPPAGAGEPEWTNDRREFHPAGAALALPLTLGRRSGPGLDACGAVGHRFTLPGLASVSATLLLVHGPSQEAALLLATQALRVDPEQRLAAQRAVWTALTSAVQVESPDPLFDALVNHWLPYQTLACRLWARAGFYQAGGAFGFRDQLQDAMSLCDHSPALLATQLRRNAARQFSEGDVQHWWHEPSGAGVRTHFSDDRLWLPLALAHYQRRTGDMSLADERVPFIEGRVVPEGAEDIYEAPAISAETASLYEHAARAVDISLRTGAHGLPLFGTGDWNDGMNRVGHEGRGESVWLGWFLCSVIDAMLPLAEQRADSLRLTRWREARASLAQALDAAAWDGAWYRRGYFDDGTPLGSAANPECSIDLIAQAWAVLSAAGQPPRAAQALDSAQSLLWEPQAGVMRLLHPPLQHARPAAGYIQAYPPGVRENGGQYNHGAVWALMAAARLQRPDWAWRLFTAVSPAHRAAKDAAYGAEPYAVAAEVYTVAPRAGQAGWSWYTGSAGWLLRAALESICGVTLEAGVLRVMPCLPAHWDTVTVWLRDGERRVRLRIVSGEKAGRSALPTLAGEATVSLAAGATLMLRDVPPGHSVLVTIDASVTATA